MQWTPSAASDAGASDPSLQLAPDKRAFFEEGSSSQQPVPTTPMFRQNLPLAVRNELDRQGLNGIPVLLSTSTDLTLSGQPRREWIVATRENVAAVRDGDGNGDAPTVQTHVPVAEVAEFRTQGAVGSGFLQAYVGDHWFDLARYSNAAA